MPYLATIALAVAAVAPASSLPRYRLTILDFLPDGNIARALSVNAHGQIAGESNMGTGQTGYPRAVTWSPEGAPTFIAGDSLTDHHAYDVNDTGIVVGEDVSAFQWHDGQLQYLDALSGQPTFATAHAANNAGVIVGGGNLGFGFRALKWTGREIIDLGTAGGNYSVAMDLNETGDIVGLSTRADGSNALVLWEDDQLIELNPGSEDNLHPAAINDHRDIVGARFADIGDSFWQAFLWREGELILLGSLGGPNSQARGINNAGDIVGSSDINPTFPFQQRAFLLRDGQMHNLNDLIVNRPPGFVMFEAHDINDAGVIVGEAIFNSLPAVRLDPLATGDLNADGQVNAADLALLLGAWNTPAADFNGDGNTDAADLAMLLGAWTAA